jgi:hypothetical protein
VVKLLPELRENGAAERQEVSWIKSPFPVVGLLQPDLHLAASEQRPRFGGDVLDLCRDQPPMRYPPQNKTANKIRTPRSDYLLADDGEPLQRLLLASVVVATLEARIFSGNRRKNSNPSHSRLMVSSRGHGFRGKVQPQEG